jgi:AraC-like DNA-binding protein
MALGVVLRVMRHLLGELYRPQRAHLPHLPLASAADYRDYYGCAAQFNQVSTGLAVSGADLRRPLQGDRLAHEAVVQYLDSIVEIDTATSTSVQALVRQILPTGRANLDLVAKQLNIHPKTLQRRLASEGTTFAETLDRLRRDTAERLLRDTRITMAHLARELGYAEQTVLTRSCHRWFGEGPAAHRKTLRGA